ncbi:hypothetical protein BCR32DRAFT_160332, partial [Anaeromyces robustus]
MLIIPSSVNYLLYFIIINTILFYYKNNIYVYGNDVPIPRFQITSKSEHITIHDSITISLKHSYIPNDNKAYSFCVIFDQDNISEDDLDNIWRGKKQDLLHDDVQFNNIYSEPGEKTIVILVSSTKFYYGKDNHIESDGLISSSTKKIRIKIENGLYHYYFSQYVDWNPYSREDINRRYFNGNSPIMHIQIINAHYPTNRQIANEATKSFSLIGEHPTLYLTNSTHSYTIKSTNILNDDFEWTIKIDRDYLYSQNPIKLKIKSKGTSILGYGIKDEDLIFHIPTVYELDLGLDMTDRVKFDNSTEKGNIKIDNIIYKISDIDEFHSTSNPNIKILNLHLSNESSNNEASLHSILALTNDFMETYKLFNLRKTNRTADPDIFTTCQGVSKLSCTVQEYLNILVMQRYIIIHTNTGVFYTSLPSYLTEFKRPTGDIPSQFHPLNELRPTVAKLGFENIKLMATVNTISPNSTYVYGIFSTSVSTGIKNRLIYSLENYFVKGLWRALTINDIFNSLNIHDDNKNLKTEFISAVRFNQQNVYLIGIPVENTELYPNMYKNCAVIVHPTDIFDKTNDFSMEFNLPPDEYFTGMSIHENNYDIFIYGTSIYHSNDGGYSFKLKARINQPININNNNQKENEEDGGNIPEYFTEFKSSHNRSFIYFITNLLNVYYGNTSVTRYLLLDWAHLNNNNNSNDDDDNNNNKEGQIIKYMIDNRGYLSILNYSLGSLNKKNNQNMMIIENGDENELYPLNQIFSSGTIPTKAIRDYSNINSLEFRTPFPFIPIIHNEQDIWLYGYGNTTPLNDSYIGFIITLKNTDDRLLIYGVNNNQNLLRVMPEKDFTHESRNEPIEITLHDINPDGLHFQSKNYIDFNSYSISDLKNPKVILTIKDNNANSRIWTKGDINKSVIIDNGSFIIKRIIDNKKVFAELIYPLSRWMDRNKSILRKTIYKSWDIYDLRGTIVEDTPIAYKIYLTEASSTELNIDDIVSIS